MMGYGGRPTITHNILLPQIVLSLSIPAMACSGEKLYLQGKIRVMPASTDYYGFLKQPSDPDVKVWRYMDFAKYVSMLETGALWFTRADKLGESFEDKLGDPFEGTIAGATRERNREMHKWVALKKSESLPTNNERDRFVEASMESDLRSNEWHRKWTYVNCWHMNKHESAAMWRLYARTNEAVAIQSTYARLRACLPTEVHMGTAEAGEPSARHFEQRGLVYLGEVQYIDVATETMPQYGYRLSPFMYKRKSFEYENEVRALISTEPYPDSLPSQPYSPQDIESKEPGWRVKVPIMDLLERVYVAPTAPNWFFEAVEAVTRKYALTLEVEQSSLDQVP
jgi:hypothetical protein